MEGLFGNGHYRAGRGRHLIVPAQKVSFHLPIQVIHLVSGAEEGEPLVHTAQAAAPGGNFKLRHHCKQTLLDQPHFLPGTMLIHMNPVSQSPHFRLHIVLRTPCLVIYIICIGPGEHPLANQKLHSFASFFPYHTAEPTNLQGLKAEPQRDSIYFFALAR